MVDIWIGNSFTRGIVGLKLNSRMTNSQHYLPSARRSHCSYLNSPVMTLEKCSQMDTQKAENIRRVHSINTTHPLRRKLAALGWSVLLKALRGVGIKRLLPFCCVFQGQCSWRWSVSSIRKVININRSKRRGVWFELLVMSVYRKWKGSKKLLEETQKYKRGSFCLHWLYSSHLCDMRIWKPLLKENEGTELWSLRPVPERLVRYCDGGRESGHLAQLRKKSWITKMTHSLKTWLDDSHRAAGPEVVPELG